MSWSLKKEDKISEFTGSHFSYKKKYTLVTTQIKHWISSFLDLRVFRSQLPRGRSQKKFHAISVELQDRERAWAAP